MATIHYDDEIGKLMKIEAAKRGETIIHLLENALIKEYKLGMQLRKKLSKKDISEISNRVAK